MALGLVMNAMRCSGPPAVPRGKAELLAWRVCQPVRDELQKRDQWADKQDSATEPAANRLQYECSGDRS